MEKVYKENPGMDDLLKMLAAIYQIGNENREILRGQVDPRDDEAVYFLGLMERATVFAGDLVNIVTHTRTGSFTSVYILGRCIMDDFITMEYVLRSDDRKETVLEINSDAMRQNLQKVEDLVSLNEKVFEGKFPYYPTTEFMADVRVKFFSRDDSGKYLLEGSSAATLKFKKNSNMSEMAVAAGRKTDDSIGRAYFFWRLWSDYVHFAPLTFGMEMENQKDMATVYKNLQELFLHLYQIIRKALVFFIKGIGYKPVESGLWRLF